MAPDGSPPTNDSHPKTPITPNVLHRTDQSVISNVLDDIHQFRSDVTLMDLQTAFIMAVFTKQPAQPGGLANQIRAMSQRQNAAADSDLAGNLESTSYRGRTALGLIAEVVAVVLESVFHLWRIMSRRKRW